MSVKTETCAPMRPLSWAHRRRLVRNVASSCPWTQAARDVVRSRPWTQTEEAMLVRMALAVIEVESGGVPAACRFEPRWTLVSCKVPRPGGCSRATEQSLQAHSWGLMQIMGTTARDLGFEGWLTGLLVPEVNVGVGLNLLARHAFRYGWVPQSVFAAYNAGRAKIVNGQYTNQKYVDRAMGVYTASCEECERGERANQT